MKEYLHYESKWKKNTNKIQQYTLTWKFGSHSDILSDNAMNNGMMIERIFNFHQDKYVDRCLFEWLHAINSLANVSEQYWNQRKINPSYYNEWQYSASISILNIVKIENDTLFGVFLGLFVDVFTKHNDNFIHWFYDAKKQLKKLKDILKDIEKENFNVYGYPESSVGFNKFKAMYGYAPVATFNNHDVIPQEKFNLDKIINGFQFCTLTTKSTLFSKFQPWICNLRKWHALVSDARNTWKSSRQ